MEVVDVAIVGGGPAGSSCAAFCAAAGLRVALIERERFPREKVCGDCLNPACLPVLERLRLGDQIRNWSHAIVNRVDFIPINGQRITINFPSGTRFVTIKRSLLDSALLKRAADLGAHVYEEATVVALNRTRDCDWKIDIVRETFLARVLVGADGRNSTVARLCKLLPPAERERIALQAHIPLPPNFGNCIVLQFLPEGYSGQAPVNDHELNLCLVGTPPTISSLRTWAEQHFHLPANQSWRTITPLTRAPIPPARQNLFFIGDAARVVEPFTGEGIYYALRSGELAADAIAKIIAGEDQKTIVRKFTRDHRAMYRRRLWINRLAREAVLHPQLASVLFGLAPVTTPILGRLTRKIVRATAALP